RAKGPRSRGWAWGSCWRAGFARFTKKHRSASFSFSSRKFARKNMDQITVEAKPREDRGKNAARRLRRQGHVPAVLYGGEGKSLTLAVNAKQLAAILRSESGRNTIFKVKLSTGDQAAMLKDWQVDPLLGSLLHVDLLRVAMDVRMHVLVPVHTFGEPQGVKLQGGVFEM